MKNNNLTVAHKSDEPVEDTENKPLYDILQTLPKPDTKFKLSASQKKWWYYFGYEFVKTKQIAQLDLVHLQKAAFWMDARSKAIAEVNKKGYKGLVQTFEKGYTNITGHVSIIEKADKRLDEVSAHFGLSIKDRQKLKSDVSPDGQLGLFDQLYEKLTVAQ